MGIVANPNAGSTRRGKRSTDATKAAATAPGRAKREPSAKPEEDEASEDAGNRKAVKRARTSTPESGDEDVEEDEAPARKRSSRAAGGNARASARVTRGVKTDGKDEKAADAVEGTPTGRGRGRGGR